MSSICRERREGGRGREDGGRCVVKTEGELSDLTGRVCVCVRVSVHVMVRSPRRATEGKGPSRAPSQEGSSYRLCQSLTRRLPEPLSTLQTGRRGLTRCEKGMIIIIVIMIMITLDRSRSALMGSISQVNSKWMRVDEETSPKSTMAVSMQPKYLQ